MAAPWIVSDELWSRIEPLLPRVERRFRYPGRKRLPDRQALQGILFVLYTGIAWRHLPAELGFGGGSTCHRRMDEWQRAGLWERLRGMFAVAVWDAPRRRLVLVRDPFGIKPLYYREVDGELSFASELDALPRGEVDLDALEA